MTAPRFARALDAAVSVLAVVLAVVLAGATAAVGA
jgi:hypothetical protein